MRTVDNLNVLSFVPLIAPSSLKAEIPAGEAVRDSVAEARQEIMDILDGRDRRLLVIVGPCSVHHRDAALDYAARLARLRAELGDRLLLVMRVYFEKPRTTVGWKGLINDPDLDGSYNVVKGLRKAREILLRINEMGVPAASELLDPIIPQYIADLLAWVSIGARTSESQTHRELASGLSMPVGFKNGTSGNLQVAIDGVLSASCAHHFLGVDEHGGTCVVATRGNPCCHIILRGGRSGPNYDPVSVITAEEQMKTAGLPPRILVDCSHANCGKRPHLQAHVLRDVVQQRLEGGTSLMGVMLESNLGGGSQKLAGDASQLAYGVSITDPCLDWDATEGILREAHAKLAACGDCPRK
ncbi:MAG: 3-deoxy-7-phosphoheptulonate synthase [Candidatus Hydrogenedentes bacterium]|nr:3-deoxy-7-phosphoheptulonate synthase [Candidatus Hydrogenedentota bacterium]